MDLFGDIAPEADDLPLEPSEKSFLDDSSANNVFSHPRNMEFCCGHADVESALLQLFKSGAVPHGLIFSGLKGIGKATMAYRFSRFLLKNGAGADQQDSLFAEPPSAEASSLDVPPSDMVFKLVASSGHPDLFSIERNYDDSKGRLKDAVEVSEIRKVSPFLRMTAAMGGWRIVVIDDADTMNRNAQNALLKILEEPPPRTVLILITHKLGALIPTIRSRCRVITFHPLGDAEIAYLSDRHEELRLLSPADLKLYHEISHGSFGRLIEYASFAGADLLEKLMELLPQAGAHELPWEQWHSLSEDLARQNQDQAFQNFQTFCVWIFEEMAIASARGLALPAALDTYSVLDNYRVGCNLKALIDTRDRLQSHFDQSAFSNLDRKQTVLGAFCIISEMATAH